MDEEAPFSSNWLFFGEPRELDKIRYWKTSLRR